MKDRKPARGFLTGDGARPVGRARVRHRSVRSCVDVRLERHAVRTVFVQELFEAPRELALGASDEGLLGERKPNA